MDGHQISYAQMEKEQKWYRKQVAEAAKNARMPIKDYSSATYFDLEAHAKLGDERAKQEMKKRDGR